MQMYGAFEHLCCKKNVAIKKSIKLFVVSCVLLKKYINH